MVRYAKSAGVKVCSFVSAAVVAASAVVGLAFPAQAQALEPTWYIPGVDSAPEDSDPKPGVEMEQKTYCASSAVMPNSQFQTIPANEVFNVEKLHIYATGKGQKVAVIDSGVERNVRLPDLQGAGDYIMGGDGLTDCDHHGTLIAGIVAARPASGDGFIGVAPDAGIISIRQTSAAYGPADHNDEAPDSLDTLSRAIVRAVNNGATVINMSVTACLASGSAMDLTKLRGALHYAVVEKNVVVVASAGNVDQTCTQNALPDPDNPLDPRGWDGTTTVSLPSYIDEYVLSVGGTNLAGDPYVNTLYGPWVDVAAPSVNIVSLDPGDGERGGLINAETDKDGLSPIAGTSFGAAYISGLAALVRERYPHLNALEVKNHIENYTSPTARGMANVFGWGPVDTVGALTGPPKPQKRDVVRIKSDGSRTYTPIAQPSEAPKYISLSILGMLAIFVAIAGARHWVSGGVTPAFSDQKKRKKG